jgi:hypothetical protein
LLKFEAKFVKTNESSSTCADLSDDQFTSLQMRCAYGLTAYGSSNYITNKEIMDYLLLENTKLLGLLHKKQATASLVQSAAIEANPGQAPARL